MASVRHPTYSARSVRGGAVRAARPGRDGAPAGGKHAHGGAVKVISSIEDPVGIKQILVHLQRKAESKEFNLLPWSRVSVVGRNT